MPGAAIVRWKAGDSVVLAVHGAFDGASAWALRLAMEEAPGREFVIDLTHAEEACEFAAGVIAAWAQRCWREKHVRFRPGTAEQARMVSAYGFELVPDDADVEPELGILAGQSWTAAGASA